MCCHCPVRLPCSPSNGRLLSPTLLSSLTLALEKLFSIPHHWVRSRALTPEHTNQANTITKRKALTMIAEARVRTPRNYSREVQDTPQDRPVCCCQVFGILFGALNRPPPASLPFLLACPSCWRLCFAYTTRWLFANACLPATCLFGATALSLLVVCVCVERLCRHVLEHRVWQLFGDLRLSIVLAVSSLPGLTCRELFSSRVSGIAFTAQANRDRHVVLRTHHVDDLLLGHVPPSPVDAFLAITVHKIARCSVNVPWQLCRMVWSCQLLDFSCTVSSVKTLNGSSEITCCSSA